MDISKFNPNKSDFDTCDWQSIIRNADTKECWNYSTLFDGKIREAIEKRREKDRLVYSLLEIVTWLRPGLNDKPIIPHTKKNDNNPPSIGDLTDDQLAVINEIFDDIDDAELKARVADLLWLRKRDFEMAKLAVQYYLESLNSFSAEDLWIKGGERIYRAFVIALSLKGTDRHQYVIDYTKNLIDKDIEKVPIHVFELFAEFGTPEIIAYYLPYVEGVAANTSDGFAAINYWETVAKLYKALKQPESAKKAYYNVAESYVKLADQAVKNSSTPYISGSSFLIKAVSIFKKYDYKRRVDELYPTLLEYQRLSMNEMMEHNVNVELPRKELDEHIEKVKEAVTGKSLKDALIIISVLCTSPELKKLKEQVLSQTSVARHIAGVVKVNNEGNTIDTSPPFDEKDDSEAMNKLLYEQSMYIQRGNVGFTIEPARRQIALEHKITPSDLLPILENSRFVPKGREMLFAMGLHAGLYEDYVTASHILIPQIEHSIREILKEAGVITSTININEVQNKLDLYTLLHNPKLIEIFGKDMVYDLRGLLVEHSGSNFRNLLAHGLIDYSIFSHWQAKYLWWITLRLCILNLPDDELKPVLGFV